MNSVVTCITQEYKLGPTQLYTRFKQNKFTEVRISKLHRTTTKKQYLTRNKEIIIVTVYDKTILVIVIYDNTWSYTLTLYVHIKTAQQRTAIQQYGDWYTGRWWVGCYIWYSEEGPGRAAAPPSPLLAVPNVTVRQCTNVCNPTGANFYGIVDTRQDRLSVRP